MRHINEAGANIIKEFESCKLKSYKDIKGVWTVGWGHTSMAGAPTVTPGMIITQQEADDMFNKDIQIYERGVLNALGSAADKLNDNQFGACVSLTYNIGPGGFADSTVAAFIKLGKMKDAADRFLAFTRSGNKSNVPGLVRRRKAERALFLS